MESPSIDVKMNYELGLHGCMCGEPSKWGKRAQNDPILREIKFRQIIKCSIPLERKFNTDTESH